MPPSLDLLELLYGADQSPLGTVIETEDAERLRQKLYAVRKERSPEFDHLSFILSPAAPATQLWIGKRRK